MATTPSSLGLTTIADGASIVASDHRNNYASIQTAVNALITILAAGSASQVFTSSGGTTIGWAAAPGAPYRKTTAKAVNTTVAATDLLNSEITIAAGAMGTNGLLRLTAWGDWVNASGSTVASPRLQVVFGGTTLFDTSISGTNVTGATRNGWKVVVEIFNLAAANAQMSHFDLRMMVNGASTQVQNTFTTGEGILTSIVAAGQVIFGEGTNPSTAVDTSLAKALVLNVINGSANAAYETKLLGAVVEVI